MRTRARGRAYIPYYNIIGDENKRVRGLGVRWLYKKGSGETIQRSKIYTSREGNPEHRIRERDQ